MTAAHALRRVGIKPIIFERYVRSKEYVGNGIGLWVNSLRCYEELGLKEELMKKGVIMKHPSYKTTQGQLLAAPSRDFHHKVPVLCLHRKDLYSVLLADLIRDELVHEGKRFTHYSFKQSNEDKNNKEQVVAHFEDGSEVAADILIGADGIQSGVREQMFPNAKLKYCGYTYYRATLKVEPEKWDELRDSFESWGSDRRFGFVPLAKPELFWFTPIRAEPSTREVVTEDTKKKLLEQYKNWHYPIQYLIENTSIEHLMRTDIWKVPTLPKWHEKQAILIGDACHATAPNLAQGAGLSIEDALDLANHLKDLNHGAYKSVEDCLEAFEKKRIPRAATVQLFADIIAFVGQLESPSLIKIRNKMMQLVPQWIKAKVFEFVVRITLGWNYRPPKLSNVSLLHRVLGDKFVQLPDVMREFRSRAAGGKGTGMSTVRRGTNFVSRAIGAVAGLPRESENLPFNAEVLVRDNKQYWTRVFGRDAFTTVMAVEGDDVPHLVEKFGPMKFQYDITVDENAIQYKTSKFSIFNITIPSFVAPKSEWEEKPTDKGWSFEGKIQMPILGQLMYYKGSFDVSDK